MPNIEPTYLRFVHDSLSQGTLNAENSASLPHGFIGLYEQEFSQNIPLDKRQSLLHLLAIWALFKGPVSAKMAADIVKTEEERMKKLINSFSSWFNSPETGKYQLYHERLRVYLLQKLSEQEIQNLNESIITFLEFEIEQKKTNETEYYALAHLHNHMALESQMGFNYERLHNYVNNKGLWKRQIELSKGFAWSQNAVQQGIKEGARRNHEMNTIRSTVNSVKLMTQEQNSAEDILNLLNEGDYETALKRAETWEGERQFKLYLLFIHELTIGKSREADFRKEACKEVLEAIEKTPEDHSVLNWTKFYPELAVYKYHEELLKMELDGIVIWRRGEYTLKDLIKRKDVNIYTIKTLAKEIQDDSKKSVALANLSEVLMEQGDKEESGKILAQSIQIATDLYDWRKHKVFSKIAISLKEQSKELVQETLRSVSRIADQIQRTRLQIVLIKVLFEIGENKESKRLVQETLLAFSEITEEVKKTNEFKDIIRDLIEVLFEIGENKESKRLVQETLLAFSEITDETDLSVQYRLMIYILMKNGYVEESLEMADKITNRTQKSMAFAIISKSLFEQGRKNESEKMMKESIRIANDLDKWGKSIAYRVIAINLNKIKNIDVEENIRLCSVIEDDNDKSIAYGEISKMLMEQGKMKESLSLAAEIPDCGKKLKLYAVFPKIFLAKGDKEGAKSAIKESIRLASEMLDINDKSLFYKEISKILMEQEDKEGAKSYLKASLRVSSLIFNNFLNYEGISKTLMHYGKKEESLRVVKEIQDDSKKSVALANLSEVLMEQGDKEESGKILAQSIQIATDLYDWRKHKVFSKIAISLKEQSKELVQETLRSVSRIADQIQRTRLQIVLIKVLFEIGENKESKRLVQETLLAFSEITEEVKKTNEFKDIIRDLIEVLFEIGENKESKRLVQETLLAFSEITDETDLSVQYRLMIYILMKNGYVEESLEMADKITNRTQKSMAFAIISKSLFEQGRKNESEKMMKESIRIANDLDKWGKSIAYRVIAINLNKIKNIDVEENIRLCSVIEDDNDKSIAYGEISKMLMEHGKMKESLSLAAEIKHATKRLKVFTDFGKNLTFKEAKNIVYSISSQENKNAFIKGLSKKINNQMETSVAINPYLFNYSELTQNLANILFYQAKIACFFEKERNDEKLNMLSEVLDIKDWRRISKNI